MQPISESTISIRQKAKRGNWDPPIDAEGFVVHRLEASPSK